MKYLSNKKLPARIRLRIPVLLELEGEGLAAVIGSVLLGIAALAVIFFH